jgi:hypothetical protein
MAKVMKKLLPALLAAVIAFSSCELYTYGILGGADKTDTLYPGNSDFDKIMFSMSGVWYSHYAGIGRLDGYRIGKWGDFKELVEDSGKTALFPNLVTTPYAAYTGTAFDDDDYFVFYDDTVYGQSDAGTGGNGGWDGLITRYIGIIRAVNLFYGDKKRGANIIEYHEGGAPQWDDNIKNGQKPFFGIFYRELSTDIVQMANAVDLAAKYAGKKYYTETATLDEAIAKNIVENEAEFISWGVVIPQDREH